MRNKINTTLLIISSVLLISILVLSMLGSINRIGYLSEFKLISSKNGDYNYDVRMKYYSKIFRNSDIYDVYFNGPSLIYLNNEVVDLSNIALNQNGNPFYNFTSKIELKYDDKIDGINYKLKLKKSVILVFIICLIYILLNYKVLLNIFRINKELILKICKLLSIFIVIISLILFILGKFNHKASLENLHLIYEDNGNYIYKLKLNFKGLFYPNLLYKLNKLSFDKKPGYVKYGYSIDLKLTDLNRKGITIKNNDDKTITLSSIGTHYSIFSPYIEPSIGEKYIFTIETKKIGPISNIIVCSFDSFNKILISDIQDEYKKYTDNIIVKKVDEINAFSRPAIRVRYPQGTIEIKSFNLEQVSDYLYLKSGNNIIFSSSKKIDDINSIGTINYKLDISNYLLVITLISLILLIFLCKKTIVCYIDKLHKVLIIRRIIVRNSIITLIEFFILVIILAAFMGRQDRNGYLSDFSLISSNNGEYTYDFRINYYSKIFRNNVIYDVYPYLNNLPDYIKSAEMNDRFGTPFGSLISTKELKYEDKIDTKYYLTINFNIFYYIAIIFIIVLLCALFYLLKEYWKYKKTLDTKDYLFVNKIEILGILLFAFQYWLFYPGSFHFADLYGSIFNSLFNTSDNWNPIFVDLSIKFLDKLGFTMMPLFFINLFLWYCGLSIIIISLYLKFKNKYIVLLFFISYLYIIFFNNVNYLKDFVSTLYLFFSCSIILFISLLQINNNFIKILLKSISILMLIIGMLHRHNFIVTVYPILIWFVYDYLKTKNIKEIKKYLFYFASIMFINAIILMSIYFIFPRIFIEPLPGIRVSYHIYLLQIAGCIVPANDSSLIPNDLYVQGKNFKDFVNTYNKDKFTADPLKNVIRCDEKIIKKIWIKAILKYPMNYIKHTFNFTKALWIQKYKAFDSYYIQLYPYNNNIERFFNRVKISPTGDEFHNTKWYRENSGIKFTELKEKIYVLLSNILPNINIFPSVLIVIILFFISGLLILLKRNLINDILIFTFSISFSGVATSMITALFSPIAVVVQSYRYIYPVVPISILSLIGFITFIYDIGGIKKFIKELRGNK